MSLWRWLLGLGHGIFIVRLNASSSDGTIVDNVMAFLFRDGVVPDCAGNFEIRLAEDSFE